MDYSTIKYMNCKYDKYDYTGLEIPTQKKLTQVRRQFWFTNAKSLWKESI